MTNWRELGYVPPSDGEDSDDDKLSISTFDEPPDNEQPEGLELSLSQLVADATEAAIEKGQSGGKKGKDEEARGGLVLNVEASSVFGGSEDEIEVDEEMNPPREESPDPLTGEPQPLPFTPLPPLPPPKLNPPSPHLNPEPQYSQFAPSFIASQKPKAEPPPPPSPSSQTSSLSSLPASPKSPLRWHATPPTSSLQPQALPQTSSTELSAQARNPSLAVVITQLRPAPIPPPPPPASTPPPSSTLPPAISTTSPFFQRSFRPRKAIQLRPYALDALNVGALEKTAGLKLRERGERNWADLAARHPNPEEVHDGEYVAPVERDPEHRPRRRSSLETPERPKEREKVASADGAKRRKISHVGKSRVGGHGRVQSSGNVFDILNSPSPSRRRHSAGGNITMPDAVPPPPNSPPLPSERRLTEAQVRAYLGMDIDPPPPPSRTSPGPALAQLAAIEVEDSNSSSTSSESTSSSGSGSDSDDDPFASIKGNSKALSYLRRKGTRGVLPASFLRVDASHAALQEERKRKEMRRKALREKEMNRPGVARTKVSHQVRDWRTDDLFGGGDTSSESDTGAARPVQFSAGKVQANSTQRREKKKRVERIDIFSDSEDMEDNRIESYGLSTVPRGKSSVPRKRNNTIGKKRQTDIRNSFATSRSIRSGGQPNTSTGTKKRKRPKPSSSTNRTSAGVALSIPRKPRAPRLGIVDAVRHLSSTSPSTLANSSHIPQFARIAARSARKRPNEGRGSPGRKIFRLDTAEATREVQDVLQSWRDGALPFHAPPSVPSPRQQQKQMRQIGLPSPEPVQTGTPGKARALKMTTTPMARMRQTSLARYAGYMAPPSTVATALRTPKAPIVERRPGTGLHVVQRNHSMITHRPTFAPQAATVEREVEFADSLWLRVGSVPPQTPSQQPYPLPRPAQQQQRRQPDLTEYWRHTPQTPQSPRRLLGRPELFSTSRPSAPSLQPLQLHPPPPGPQSHQRLKRKTTPHRVDTEVLERRQPPQQDLLLPAPTRTSPVPPDGLSRLLPYGAKYSLSFDTSPLKVGSKFAEDTWVGRGLLRRVIETPPARLHNIAAVIPAHGIFSGQEVRWGAWNDDIGRELEALAGKREDECDEWEAFTQFVVNWIHYTVGFWEAEDIGEFSMRILEIAERVLEPKMEGDVRGAVIKVIWGICLCFQVMKITEAVPRIQDSLSGRVSGIMGKLAATVMARLVSSDLVGRLRNCYEIQRRRDNFKDGISSSEGLEVDALVSLRHIFDALNLPNLTFWDVFNTTLGVRELEECKDVIKLDTAWRMLFTILPLGSFDKLGIAFPVTATRHGMENWALVRSLLAQPLKLAFGTTTSGTQNDYIRILLRRIFHLMSTWHWSAAQDIIPPIYAAFSSHNLSNLPHEPPPPSSSEFLTSLHLTDSPAFAPSPSDTAFTLFLKTTFHGIRTLSSSADSDPRAEKKVRSLVMRLLPNHRRDHPRDQPLLETSLHALRNHHDLLTVLFTAPPKGARPPIDALRIINPETSHREVVTVAVRTWETIASFLIAREEADAIDGVMDWWTFLVEKVGGQFSAVRDEARKEVERMGEGAVDEGLVEMVVRRNRKALEKVLTDLVAALRRRLETIPSSSSDLARKLVRGPQGVVGVMSLVLAGHGSTGGGGVATVPGVVEEGLRFLEAYMEASFPKPVNRSASATPVPQSAAVSIEGEESQDYGDSHLFDDLVLSSQDAVAATAPVPIVDKAKLSAEHFLATIFTQLQHLISNSFGADLLLPSLASVSTRTPFSNTTMYDPTLQRLLNTWIATADYLTGHKLKSWDNFVEHAPESWASLRQTEQWKKFGPVFISQILEKGGREVWLGNRETILRWWMSAAVSPEGSEWEAKMTAAILDIVHGDEEIVKNLPFAVEPDAVKYRITTDMFMTRRLAMLGALFENMRAVHDAAPDHAQKQAIRRTYEPILRAVQTTIKENYLSLSSKYSIPTGHTTAVTPSTPASASLATYTSFARSVLGLLMQHASGLTEIDKFFVDSPEWGVSGGAGEMMVEKVRKYAVGIKLRGGMRTLGAFLRGKVDRSILVDGETETLSDALTSALLGDISSDQVEEGLVMGEQGFGYSISPSTASVMSPTMKDLRRYFMTAIIPAYVTVSLRQAAGFILANPILSLAGNLCTNLLTTIDTASPIQRAEGLADLQSLLMAICSTVEEAANTTLGPRHGVRKPFWEIPEQLAVLTRLMGIVTAVTATLPVLMPFPIVELDHATNAVYESIRFLYRFSLYIQAHLNPNPRYREEVSRPLPPVQHPLHEGHSVWWEQGRRDMTDELSRSLESWWQDGVDTWCVEKGGVRREVRVRIGEGVGREFVESVRMLRKEMGVAGVGAGEEGWGEKRRRRLTKGMVEQEPGLGMGDVFL